MCEFGQKIAIGLDKYKLEVGINNLENKWQYVVVKIYPCCQRSLLVRLLLVLL